MSDITGTERTFISDAVSYIATWIGKILFIKWQKRTLHLFSLSFFLHVERADGEYHTLTPHPLAFSVTTARLSARVRTACFAILLYQHLLRPVTAELCEDVHREKHVRVTLMHPGAFDTQLRMDTESTLNKWGGGGGGAAEEVTSRFDLNWWKPRKWIAFADGWLPIWCASLVVRRADMNYRCMNPHHHHHQAEEFILQRTQRLFWFRLLACFRAWWDNVDLINTDQIVLMFVKVKSVSKLKMPKSEYGFKLRSWIISF